MHSRFFIYSIPFFIALLFPPNQAHGWGFWGHKRINRMAVFTLPPEMMGFYKQNIEFLTQHAVDPDKRRYAVQDEAARHYIDLDHYGKLPFDNMPREWKYAVAKFSEDTLKAYGIVPWRIEQMYTRLIDAFKKKDARYILQTSADLGHYIGDAHVPLHTTKNYNGQLTNQYGIHGLLESRIPELLGDATYDFWVGKALFIEKPLDAAWKAVLESHVAVDSVFQFEKDATKEIGEDLKYVFETKGATTLKSYSEPFTILFNNKLANMMERRMKTATITVGSFWYSAWVEAGQPDLDKLSFVPLSKTEEQEIDALNKAYQMGTIRGRTEAN